MVEQPPGGAASADAADDAVEMLDRPLPEGVRRRVVALVSDAFGGLTVTELPAQLRQYARFTPTRRAKFAGNAMAAALAGDATFRRRIGERLRETQPELSAALEAGSPPAAADPVDVAAAAYVLRPDGWVKLLAAAGEEAQRADAERADEEKPARTGTAPRGAGPGPRPDEERDRTAPRRPRHGPQGGRVAPAQTAQRGQRGETRGGGPAPGPGRERRRTCGGGRPGVRRGERDPQAASPAR